MIRYTFRLSSEALALASEFECPITALAAAEVFALHGKLGSVHFAVEEDGKPVLRRVLTLAEISSAIVRWEDPFQVEVPTWPAKG